jgi:hypothetical protein
MLINILCFRARLVSAMLSFLALVIAIGVVAGSTWAQNGATQTAPPSQAGSGYWTPERMRSANPAMPTVPGTPRAGSWTSGLTGPSGGASAQGPTIPPQSFGTAPQVLPIPSK